ncbi:MAG: hypothetical protein IPO98_15275 [Saprospiraceae bacterium]|nr:hypothetical protein [Saprospiraceae bacterium]
MKNEWKDFLADRRRAMNFVLLVIIGTSFVSIFTRYMIWNESRDGMIFNDPILSLFTPVDLSRITMFMTLLPVTIGMLFIFRKPAGTVYFFFIAIFICTLRTFTLYCVPLEPPFGIIPLTDPVIEKLFYGNNVLLKDLFFSGHTANIIIIGLLIESRKYKCIIFTCAAMVGLMLMIQHVHFSIDVFAAPFFAVAAYKLSVYLAHKTLLKDYFSFQEKRSIFSWFWGLRKAN